MSRRPEEVTHVHTRLLKCTLALDHTRAYWSHSREAGPVTAQGVFEGYWFGARSLAATRVLLTNMRARFDAYPEALDVLQRWRHMSPDTRQLICHWHMQLSDPLYRSFTAEVLPARREGPRAEISRDVVVTWVGAQGPGRWTMATRIQFASKLLSSAHAAGLLGGKRDPRAVLFPRVPDEALAYLMYLLRGVAFEGTLLNNPYAASVGLHGEFLEGRLRDLPGVRFDRQGDLVDFGWQRADLGGWADAYVGAAAEIPWNFDLDGADSVRISAQEQVGGAA